MTEPTASLPLLSAPDVLAALLTLSRDESHEGGDEGELLRSVHALLIRLLPGRMVALRRIDPQRMRAIDVHVHGGELVLDALERPPTVVRSALRHAKLRESPPSADATAGSGALHVTEEHALLFRDASTGFSVPLVAGGDMLAEIHVNYGSSADAPVEHDQALVIPIANHVAAVAHTRRLLRETAYLQEYLAQLVEQAGVLIVAVDFAGRITVWNRAMHQLTGLGRATALSRDLAQWLGPLGGAELAQVVRQVIDTGEPAAREVRLMGAAGSPVRAAFNVAVVRGHGGQPAAVLAVGQDVTALRALQNQVIHAEKLATLGQIAAGVAHEINNPLTSVQVCAEAVLRKASASLEGRTPNAFDAADVDRLSKIKEGAERIRRFARDLVSYARPSGAEITPVSLNDVVAQALSFCEHVLSEAHALTERDFQPDLPALRVIRDQLLQVVINLVTNAAQALPAGGGRVRVRTYRAGDGAVGLAISDTGTGIREEDRAHVFEPFFSTKPPGRGTGLGLSIVRNIVYAHGGQITFQNRQGGGTTFVVTLPTNHPARASAAVPR